MTDTLNSEETHAYNRVVEVKTLDNVIVKKGSFYFNPSHSTELHEEAKLVYENKASTVFRVTGEFNVNEQTGEKTPVEPYDVLVIDLNKLQDSMVVYNDQSTEALLHLMEEELKNDFIITQAAKFLVDAKMAANLRLVRAKRTLTKNSEAAVNFLSVLDNIGVNSPKVSSIRGEISKTVADAQKLFGGKVAFGKGVEGWKFSGEQYTPNTPDPKPNET